MRLVPLTTTMLPRAPTDGVKPVIFGATLKIATLAAVPIRLVMVTGPVSARPAPRRAATSPSPP